MSRHRPGWSQSGIFAPCWLGEVGGIGAGVRSAADKLLHHNMDPGAVHWLQTNLLKTELELGHCLRLSAEGPCECDLVLTCPKFVTSTEYNGGRRLRPSSSSTPKPAAGPREVERPTCVQRRIQSLLAELTDSSEPAGLLAAALAAREWVTVGYLCHHPCERGVA